MILKKKKKKKKNYPGEHRMLRCGRKEAGFVCEKKKVSAEIANRYHRYR